MERIDSRGLPDAVLNERRQRAVKLCEAGVLVRETARQCELSTHTVVAAHKAFRQGGWAAVKVQRTGRPKGSGRQLSAEHERQVQKLIQDRTPDQLKMSYALWTRQGILLDGEEVAAATPRAACGQSAARSISTFRAEAGDSRQLAPRFRVCHLSSGKPGAA